MFKNEKTVLLSEDEINKDYKIINNIINEFQPNYVINFAAQGMVAESWKKPVNWYTTNVISQVALHDEIRKFDFKPKSFSAPDNRAHVTCSPDDKSTSSSLLSKLLEIDRDCSNNSLVLPAIAETITTNLCFA